MPQVWWVDWLSTALCGLGVLYQGWRPPRMRSDGAEQVRALLPTTGEGVCLLHPVGSCDILLLPRHTGESLGEKPHPSP